MRAKKVITTCSSHYIAEPYSILQHYKRTYKFLHQLRLNQASLLCLGRNDENCLDWKNDFRGIALEERGGVTRDLLTNAATTYDAILCLDMVGYAKVLMLANLPVVGVATVEDLEQHVDLCRVIDYLLPFPTSRTEAVIRDMLREQTEKGGKPIDSSFL
eukprot:GHVN01090154.1.p3 GENE.GHVN01090154.1~~GHVN01090154.1.p3  ORF type:complete len:159 (-),score=16.96 GHVN01090154.1:1142-1618(-)